MVYLTNKRELSFTQAFHNALNEIFFLLKEPLVLNRAFSLHTVLVYTKQTQNKDICKKNPKKQTSDFRSSEAREYFGTGPKSLGLRKLPAAQLLFLQLFASQLLPLFSHLLYTECLWFLE